MKIKLTLLVLGAFVLLSCRTTQVKVDYNDSVDFFKFRSFNWLPRSGTQKEYVSVKEQKIFDTIENLLQEKQLQKSDKPDLLVAVNVTEKDKVYYYPRHSFGHFHDYRWGYSSFHTYEPEVYTESTIFIALVDPQSKKAVWEGSSKSSNFENISDEKLKRILTAILTKYPPVAENAYEEVK